MDVTRLLNHMSHVLKYHQTTLQNVAIMLSIIAGEIVFEIAVFKCPCEQTDRCFYSWMFIIGPAIIMFIFGVTISSTTWRIVSGRCRTPGGTVALCVSCDTCVKSLYALINTIIQAMVAALVWLFIAFMDGSYLACCMSITECKVNDSSLALNNNHKAISQIIGLALLIVVSLSLLAIMFIRRMSNKYTYEHIQYYHIYRDMEEKEFGKQSKQIARQHAKENINKFFSQDELKNNYILKSWNKIVDVWRKLPSVGLWYGSDHTYLDDCVINEELCVTSEDTYL
ncbi:calcium homeostasis modulator protein-like [Saccoglossus kowalevskii]